jgi:hypothetical protein
MLLDMIIRGDPVSCCENIKACGFYLEFALECESITLYRVTGYGEAKWQDTDACFLISASRVKSKLERTLDDAKGR